VTIPGLTRKTAPKLVSAHEVALETNLPLSSNASVVPSTSDSSMETVFEYEERVIKRRKPKHKQRASAREIVKLKAQGLTHAEIAELLGLSTRYVKNLVYLAGQHGWLKTEDVEDHLTYITAHKIVRNVDAALDGVVLGEGQQEMTIAAAKGRGFFKQHEAASIENTPQSMVLGVKIELVQPVMQGTTQLQLPAPTGAMGGTPSYVDAELVK